MVDPHDGSRKKPVWSLRFAIFTLLVCAVVFLPFTVLSVAYMLPTVVAAVIDRNPQRVLWVTVGAMNLAGAIPGWLKLFDLGGKMSDAIILLSNPLPLLVAFGSAGIGWIIHLNITPLVATVLARRGEKRLKEIEKRQQELQRRWGPDVVKDA